MNVQSLFVDIFEREGEPFLPAGEETHPIIPENLYFIPCRA